MGNNKQYREIRWQCQDAYMGGMTNAADLAEKFGVSRNTVTAWVKKYRWDILHQEEANLTKNIDVARQKAILKALQEFEKDPGNVALQSLVSMLKSEQKRMQPARELNDYIVKFMDQTTDYLLEKGFDGLLKGFQEILMDLAEYLRVRNA